MQKVVIFFLPSMSFIRIPVVGILPLRHGVASPEAPRIRRFSRRCFLIAVAFTQSLALRRFSSRRALAGFASIGERFRRSRFASAVEPVGVDGSATQPLFRRHLRPLSFCGTTVSPLLRRHRRTPSGGRGAWRSGPSSSSLLLFPPSHGGRALTDSTEIEYPHLGRLRIKKYISVGKFIFFTFPLSASQ